MRNGIVKTTLSAVLALIWTGPLAAQQIRFQDFSSITFLQTNGSHQALFNGNTVLRLTSGYPLSGPAVAEASTTYFTLQQPVNLGFTTYFQFQIHSANGQMGLTPGDGVAFLIQNASSTDASYGATGAGITSRGTFNRPTGGGIGYTGIPNSLAIEFDTAQNSWDLTSNHVAVQGCGPNTNGPAHVNGPFTIGTNNNVNSCLVNSGLSNAVPTLGVSCSGTTCVDGQVHTVVIEYGKVGTVWTLLVYIDQPLIPTTHTPCPSAAFGCTKAAVPAINIPYNIDWVTNSATGLKLATDPKTHTYGYAWVGFSASQSTQAQVQDILTWEFTPHTATSVTQIIQDCPAGSNGCMPPPTPFVFGAHDTKVYEYQDFHNTGNISMTVTATPWLRSTFYQQRLKGTNFPNEQCIVYLGTGNSCIVYSITCQDPSGNPVACPISPPGLCPANGSDPTQFPFCLKYSTSYYSTDPVTPGNADYLKADPPLANPPSNCWYSFFVSYVPQIIDSRTTGTGPTGSDQVATFKVGTAPPPTNPPPGGCPLLP
jgi:hypothetical protein